MTERQREDDEARRSRDRAPKADDPDAPGSYVDDDEADEVPEPNEPG
jgi:hypothetical protein